MKSWRPPRPERSIGKGIASIPPFSLIGTSLAFKIAAFGQGTNEFLQKKGIALRPLDSCCDTTSARDASFPQQSRSRELCVARCEWEHVHLPIMRPLHQWSGEARSEVDNQENLWFQPPHRQMLRRTLRSPRQSNAGLQQERLSRRRSEWLSATRVRTRSSNCIFRVLGSRFEQSAFEGSAKPKKSSKTRRSKSEPDSAANRSITRRRETSALSVALNAEYVASGEPTPVERGLRGHQPGRAPQRPKSPVACNCR